MERMTGSKDGGDTDDSGDHVADTAAGCCCHAGSLSLAFVVVLMPTAARCGSRADGSATKSSRVWM